MLEILRQETHVWRGQVQEVTLPEVVTHPYQRREEYQEVLLALGHGAMTPGSQWYDPR